MLPPAGSAFHLGVNLPWLDYGRDFGRDSSRHSGISLPARLAVLDREFASIQSSGATLVRWFLFADGRCGFLTERDIPLRPDDLLFPDVAAALQIASSRGLQLCFSLLDFLWLQEHQGKRSPHPAEHVFHSAAGRAAFLENVLIPLFREFRGHPALFAWEIANEPEWAIREFDRSPSARLALSDFRSFAAEVVSAVHEFAARPATLGSARIEWLRAWSEIGLDFLQAHFYPSADPVLAANLPEALARAAASLNCPLLLGEIPARDPAIPGYSLERTLAACHRSGLLGAAVWRWTSPDSGASDFAIGRVEPASLRGWLRSQGDLGSRA